MRKLMNGITAVLAVITLVLGIVYHFYSADIIEILLISFATTLYHFAMRVAVGFFVSLKNNQWNYNNTWFREKGFEKRFFKFIRIKKWKDRLPTYSPESYSLKSCDIESIVKSTCQSEVIHEAIVVLSFLPIFLSPWLGAAGVFIATSIIAAFADSLFVMLQRYNRPRLIKLVKKQHIPNNKHSK